MAATLKMRQKVLALLIVCVIGGVTSFVLYSPAALQGPDPRPAAVPTAPALAPITTIAVTSAQVHQPSAGTVVKRRQLKSARVRVEMIATPSVVSPPADAEELPPLIVQSSFAAAVPLAPPAEGIVPTAAASAPYSSAGRAIGAAFVTTGRSVGTAFKRVF